ncbi:hypothetical protein ACFL6T_02970 [Candidatus Zixiibacteriota bacterium]
MDNDLMVRRPIFVGCDLGRSRVESDVLVRYNHLYYSPGFQVLARNRKELICVLRDGVPEIPVSRIHLMVDAPLDIPKCNSIEYLGHASLHQRECDRQYREIVNSIEGREFQEHDWHRAAVQWLRWKYIQDQVISVKRYSARVDVSEGLPQGTICQFTNTCRRIGSSIEVRMQTINHLLSLLDNPPDGDIGLDGDSSEHILDAAILALQVFFVWNDNNKMHKTRNLQVMIPTGNTDEGIIWAVNPQIVQEILSG